MGQAAQRKNGGRIPGMSLSTSLSAVGLEFLSGKGKDSTTPEARVFGWPPGGLLMSPGLWVPEDPAQGRNRRYVTAGWVSCGSEDRPCDLHDQLITR